MSQTHRRGDARRTRHEGRRSGRKDAPRMHRNPFVALRSALAALALAAILAAPAGAALPDSVRVTEHGTRWHVGACPALRGPFWTVARVKADSAGYTPCRRCTAPPKVKRPSRLERARGAA